MGICAAGPTRERRGCARMTCGTIAPARSNVVDKRLGAERSLCSFARVQTVVAGVAARRADRRMVHRISDETCRRIRVAIATLHTADRSVWRRRQTQRRNVIVAT